ncbi:MAG TPA: ABC transporter permease subunit [Planctomycetota bacterium]|nr:ABC transporter permease subunit [Planctomycetota bacterium]
MEAETADRPRPVPRTRAFWIDALLVAFVAAVAGWLIGEARQWSAPFRASVEVDLSPSALPGYALRSLARGCAAYVVSFAITIAYGTWAARSARAERVLIPLLDLLQGIPVLGFLPGLVLGMIALFPSTSLGLELACVLMIVTGQAWNMVFAYYGSVRSVSKELKDIARVHRFTPRQYFGKVELSTSMIPLVWNSMISMASGWFFLNVNESFQLEGRDFRLPGLGSYMSVAIERGDGAAQVWAVLAMILMILATDQLLWRPLVAWSYNFTVDEASGAPPPRSWVLDLLRRSAFAEWRRRREERRLQPLLAARPASRLVPPSGGAPDEDAAPSATPRPSALRKILIRAAVLGAALFGLVGAWRVSELLARVDAAGWIEVLVSVSLTFLRIVGALAISLAWTLPVGLWIGSRPRLVKVLSPVVQTAAAFPAPMIFPLVVAALLALRVDFSWGCAVLMTLGAQWYLLFNIIAGAASIPQELRQIADVYRLGGFARWRRLELPAIFPHLVTGLVTAAGGAWNACIVTEYVRLEGGRTLRTRGLGALLSEATAAGDFALLAASICGMSLAIVALNRFLWKRLYTLAETRYGLAA